MNRGIYKYLSPFDMDEVPDIDVKVMFGHVRAPTGGSSNLISEVHPFETKDLALAHNGIILNCSDYPEWSIGTIDSHTIIGGIQFLLDRGIPLITAITIVAGSLDGQQACWLYYKPTDDIYLWRVMSPIHVGYFHKDLCFSSIRCPIASSPLSEGVIYRFDPDSFYLETVNTFPYYNPYKKKEN